MRKLFGIALVSIVLMSSVFGASPVFAQTEEEATQVFAVSSELMEELDSLVRMLEEAEHANDQELIKALQEKIQVIKEGIRHASETPTAVGESEEPQPGFTPPTAVASSQGVVSSSPIDWCAELKGLKEKKAHYEALYALSDEELKKLKEKEKAQQEEARRRFAEFQDQRSSKLDPKDRPGLLADLQSGDPDRLLPQLEKLRRKSPKPPRLR